MLQVEHPEVSEHQFHGHLGPQHMEGQHMDGRSGYQGVPKSIQAWPVLQPQADQQQQPNELPSAVQQRAAQYAGDEGLARPPTRPPSDWRPRVLNAEPDEALAPAGVQPDDNIAR